MKYVRKALSALPDLLTPSLGCEKFMVDIHIDKHVSIDIQTKHITDKSHGSSEYAVVGILHMLVYVDVQTHFLN